MTHAQDTLGLRKDSKLIFDFGCGMYYEPVSITSAYSVTSSQILLPALLSNRRASQPLIQGYWGLLNNDATNNPLFHGAFYGNIKIKYMIDSLSVTGQLIGEQLSASYGVYEPANTIFYPKLKIRYDNDFKLLNRTFNIDISYGNNDNERTFEGLTIYNIDAQSAHLSLQTGHFQFTFVQIADLEWIGLNIGDEFQYIFGLNKIKIIPNYLMDIKAGPVINTSTYYDTIDKTANTFDASIAFYNANTRFYAQYSVRGGFGNTANTSAALAGISHSYKSKRWDIDAKVEARYYSALYNLDFYNEDVYYRNPLPTSAITYPRDGNFIGPDLYPLQLYDRPFSQWAVFTEYQNKNVNGISSEINAKYYFAKHLLLFANLDFNDINAEGQNPFLYDFYTVGIGAHWDKINEGTIGITDKAMNLDETYPTFYLLKYPTVIFKFTRKLSWN